MIIMSVAVLPTVAQVAQPVAQVASVPQAAPIFQVAPVAEAAPVVEAAPAPVVALAPVDPALVVIAPDALPDGVVGVQYSQMITVSGGTAPYIVTVEPAVLTNGLTWTEMANGKYTVAGAAPTVGIVTIKVTATDSAATPATLTKTYTFEIKGAGAPPVLYAEVTGTLGNEGWYTSDVLVHWVIQEDKPLTPPNPCLDQTVVADTTDAGVTFTFEGEDPLPGSGMDTCVTVTYEGPDNADAVITSSCFDIAGNETVSAPCHI
jgi:hypothetical protein